MAENAKTHPITIDLSQFKLHIDLKKKIELTLHFNSPSRRFYLSVIALVVNEMKRQGKLTSIPLEGHHDLLALLNDTVGGSAGSSDRENLLPRIYRKWQHALPNLEEAPLFKVLGRKKEYDEGAGKTYPFTEAEKDSWANLFEYKGSEENVRLKFAIDRIGAGLDDVDIIYEDCLNGDAWERFISSLRDKVGVNPEKEEIDEVHKEPEAPVSPPAKWKIARSSWYRRAGLIVAIGVVVGAAAIAIWEFYIHHAAQPEVTPKERIASLQHEKSLTVVPPLTEVPPKGKEIEKSAPKEKVAPPSPGGVSKAVTPAPPELEVASKDKMAFPLPDKPSVAVLPFVNIGGDKELGYFSDGLTDEIINALSKVPQIFVIGRNSTFFYKGKTVNIRQVAENLGVQYVVEGSVRKSVDAVRVSAQLIDAIKGHHLWSERYDRKMKDFFALQDEITMKILTELRVKLTGDETTRIYTKGTTNLQAFLKVLEGDGYMRQYNKEANALAIPLYLEAIELDPNYAMAYLRLSRTYTTDVYLRPGESSEEKLSNAVKSAQKAIELDNSLADAHAALSYAFLTMRQHDKAIEVGERAARLNPNSASALFTLAQSLHYSGRWEEALPLLRQAIRLNPWVPIFYTYFGTACRETGRYQEGIAAFKKSLSFAPNDLFANIDLAALYMYAEREDEARAAVAEIMRIDPNFSLERYGDVLPWKELPEKSRFFDALHKAGLK